MELFYSPAIKGEIFTLETEESKHIVKVLRKKNGDRFHITDGLGHLFEVQIIDDRPKACVVRILSTLQEQAKQSRLHIAIAPTKNTNRTEWFLEKSTEIGIDKITPLLCEHSERKTIKPERLQKVIVAAAKQSIKTFFPHLSTMSKFTTFIQQNFTGDKYIALCRDENLKPLQELCSKKNDTLILIGPEGGFSHSEIHLAKKNGFIPISLGDSRLRTETAGIVACTIINNCPQ
jgi:16S rRNA (uracil1498-N3)-methyltransferase